MSDYLLVVEGLMADGADAALFVSEGTYKAAMFACIFAEPVHGYVWCDRHGWVLADEACVCDDCVWEALQAQADALSEQHAAEFGEDWLDEGDRGEMAYRRINACEKAEFPHGEFDDGAHWREPAQALCPLSPGQWASEPCGDPKWTEEALDADVAHMDEVEERAQLNTERAAEWAVQQFVSQYGQDWPGEGDHGEMAYRRINRADPGYEPVYSREKAVQHALYDMAKGKMPRAFR